MRVKSKYLFEPQLADYLETYTIDETELAFRSRNERSYSGIMYLGVDPFDIKKRDYIFLKSPYRLNSQPVLYKREGFNQDVIARDQNIIRA